MIAYHHTELIVWQLADALRLEVIQLTNRPPVSRDFRFRSEIREAGSDIPADIAEGFRRRSPPDIKRFMVYANAGVAEVSDRLLDGQERGYWTDSDLAHARRLIKRIDAGLEKLIKYLGSEAADRNAPPPPPRRKRPRRRANPPEPS